MNDLGWSLYQGGQLEESRTWLERAVAMNPSDELAAEDLRICLEGIRSRSSGK